MSAFSLLLLDLLLKSSALLALAAAATQLWRRASAAQRHLIWLTAFGALLLLPVARIALPPWKLRLPDLAPTARTDSPAPQRILLQARPTADSGAKVVGDSTISISQSAQQWRTPRPEMLLFVVWSAGALLVLGRRLVGAVRVRLLWGTSTPVMDEDVREVAAAVAAALGVRQFDLRQSKQCRVPLTWGSRRPVVMLPADALSWPAALLLAALQHEFAHVRRRDHFTRLGVQIIAAFYWPNPLVWFAARALRSAQEQACDDLVLQAGTRPADYAAQLLRVGQMLATRNGIAGSVVAMAQSSNLGNRVRALLDNSRNRRPVTGKTALLVGIGTAALLIATAAAQFASKPPARNLPLEVEFVGGEHIDLEAEFIELPAAAFNALFPAASDAPGQLATLSPSGAADLRQRLGPLQTANYLDDFPSITGNTLVSAPRVPTGDGQRAVIEIIHERDIWEAGGHAIYNEGTTLEMEPRLQRDGLDLSLRAILTKQLPGTQPPLTYASFHRIDFQSSMPTGLHLRAGEVGVFGGWETVHAGRKLLLLVEGRSAVLTLTTKLTETVLPQVRLRGATVQEAAEIIQRMAGFEASPIVIPAGAAEVRVTLDLREVSAMSALQEVARAAGLRLYLAGGAVHLAPPLPRSPAAQAEAIILPNVQLTGVSLAEAVDRLFTLARKQHPGAARLRLERQLTGDFDTPRVTLRMENVPLSAALSTIAELTQCTLSADDGRLYLHPAGVTPAGAKPLHSAPESTAAQVARIATPAEVLDGANIALEVRAFDVSPGILTAAGLPSGSFAEGGPVAGVFTGKELQEFLQKVNAKGTARLLAAPSVTTHSQQKVTLEIPSNGTSNHRPRERSRETITLTVLPALGPDAQTLDLEITPWRMERRAVDQAIHSSTRKITTSVSIFSGQTVALTLPHPTDPEHAALLLVTAFLLPQ